MSSENFEFAHKHSFGNFDEIRESALCGCFYCYEIFESSAITDWVDEKDGTKTAICPRCLVDSVIGDRSGHPINSKFLKRVGKRYF